MEVICKETDRALVVYLSGELDHHSAESVRNTIDQQMDTSEKRHLILSFRGVLFMDSAGVGTVMGRYNKVKARGGKLFITECNPYAKRILEMAGIFTIAQLTGSLEDAVAQIREEVE